MPLYMEDKLLGNRIVCIGSENNVIVVFSDKISTEHVAEMDDIKSLVNKLFTALHLESHQTRRERELLQKIELLKEELLPLEQVLIFLNYRPLQYKIRIIISVSSVFQGK